MELGATPAREILSKAEGRWSGGHAALGSVEEKTDAIAWYLNKFGDVEDLRRQLREKEFGTKE